MNCNRRPEDYLRENDIPFRAQHHPRSKRRGRRVVCRPAITPAGEDGVEYVEIDLVPSEGGRGDASGGSGG
jgi:hypothetical protein